MDTARDFQLDSEDLGDRIRVLTLTGELDLAGSPALKAEFTQSTQEGHDLILADLSRATMIDSTTLAVLLDAHRRLAGRGGALALVITSPAINRILEVTLMDQTLDVHTSREDALVGLRTVEGA